MMGFAGGRHHGLRDVLFEAARAAEMRPWREQQVDSSGRRPADVLFPQWSRGRPLAIDVTVSHPSQGTIAQQARSETSASERAALLQTAEKERKYSALCAAQGVDFMGVAVCAYGGWLSPAADVVGSLQSV